MSATTIRSTLEMLGTVSGSLAIQALYYAICLRTLAS